MNKTWVGSPNYDESRATIDRVVIHWMAGTLASADAQFKKTGGTSAHYGIENDVVHQYVLEKNTAYHAGNYAMNQRSIGIEHSAAPGRDATEETYKTSGELVAQIAKAYNIPLDRAHIIKHSEVVPTQCCGTVDVDKIISIARSINSGSNPSTSMTIDTQVYELLVKKATQHDKTCAYLEIPSNPKDVLFEDIQKVIAGFKGATTSLQTQLIEASKQVAAAQQEVKNRDIVISKLKEDLTKITTSTGVELVEAAQKYSALKIEAETLKTQLTAAIEEVGTVTTTLKTMEVELEACKNSKPQPQVNTGGINAIIDWFLKQFVKK